ncbi:brachyurin-like [Phlebotomus argentipes]|uniref:brachyurin-like n=1 Tax=Phlebotomus argentipes TaxID=94469 RepID=UPI0028934F90|nr:brachyurin-like [Phlebotomus argentipes]
MWSLLLGLLPLCASVLGMPSWWSTLRAPHEIPEWQQKHPALMALLSASPDFQTRIVNGNEASPHQFPYQAALVVRLESDHTICGGSLISENYILTAAHCTDLSIYVTAYLGVHNLSDYAEHTRIVQTIFRSQIIVHEQYNTSGYQNDISVMKLPVPVMLSYAIQLVRLPSYLQQEESFLNVAAKVSGWGRTTDASQDTSDILRYAEVSVISNAACRTLYPTLQDNNICTRGDNRAGTCQGDSGGPMVITEDDGSFTQVGIVSFGSSLGCAYNWPNVFVRLTSFLCWLNCHTDVAIRDHP